MRLDFFCNPFGESGYAIHSRELIRALMRKGIRVAPFPTNPRGMRTSDPILRESVLLGLDLCTPSIAIKLDAPAPIQVGTFFGNRRIFYAMLEVDRLPCASVAALNTVEEIWTTSTWGRDTFVRSGVTRPIRVVPEGVNTSIFEPCAKANSSSRPFRFLAVGKFEQRENFQGLVQAYLEEFQGEPDVELILHLGRHLPPVELGIQSSRQASVFPKILFSMPGKSAEEMVSLYQCADAFVLPTHGEGWGLPIMEAMACGLPVITTGIGAITEYATRDVALLLDYKLVPARQTCRV